MEFQDVVRKRKMVRSFEDRPIPREVVDRILANAQRAPSAGFSQGSAFLALEGPEQTARYWDALWPADKRAEFGWADMFKAPLLVVCLSHKLAYIRRYSEPDKGWTDMDEKRWPVPYWDIDTGMAAMLVLLTAVDEKRWPVPYWDIDTGMAAMLILMTAVDAGLGAVFFGVSDQPKFREIFGVPDELTAIGTIAMGYAKPHDRPSPSLKRGHRPAEQVIHKGNW